MVEIAQKWEGRGDVLQPPLPLAFPPFQGKKIQPGIFFCEIAHYEFFYVSSVRCIFGVMYMHFWYAMHRHLWGCFVVCWNNYYCAMHLWCNVSWSWVHALSAKLHRIATAINMHKSAIYMTQQIEESFGTSERER